MCIVNGDPDRPCVFCGLGLKQRRMLAGLKDPVLSGVRNLAVCVDVSKP